RTGPSRVSFGSPVSGPDPVDPLAAARKRLLGRWLSFGRRFIDQERLRVRASVDVCRGRRVWPGVPTWGIDAWRVPSSTLQSATTRLETRTKECNSDASH